MARIGDIRTARKWVEELAAKHKGVRVAYLLCRMINMKPLWIRAGVEPVMLDAAQRVALHARQAEPLWGD